jgi:hypothetical protein
MPDPERAARLRFAFQLIHERFGRSGWADLGLLVSAAGARLSPLPGEMVRRWAEGRVDPGVDVLESICRLLDSDIDPAWLAWGQVGATALVFDGWQRGREEGAPGPDRGQVIDVPLPAIRGHLAAAFRRWGITLPLSALATRSRGHLLNDGWWVQYLFGVDEEGWYLDYYATHPAHDDRHERLGESGRHDALETMDTLAVGGSGRPPAEEGPERSREIARVLVEKGFGLAVPGRLRDRPATGRPGAEERDGAAP